MSKKQRYNISMRDGSTRIVNGATIGFGYGIHKREDNMYVLTHLASGKKVASSSRLKTLALLANEPEFFLPLDVESMEMVNTLAKAVQRFFNKNGWK